MTADRLYSPGRGMQDQMVADRSHGSYAPFSLVEADRIRKAAAAGNRLVCPRCDRSLEIGAPIDWGGATARLIRCDACERQMVVHDNEYPPSGS